MSPARKELHIAVEQDKDHCSCIERRLTSILFTDDTEEINIEEVNVEEVNAEQNLVQSNA